jgi:hypothetical protein
MWFGMFGLFALHILVGNSYISFGIRHFFRTHLFTGEALRDFVLYFFVRNAIFIFVSLKSLVIYFICFPYYITKTIFFVWCCELVFLLCLRLFE